MQKRLVVFLHHVVTMASAFVVRLPASTEVRRSLPPPPLMMSGPNENIFYDDFGDSPIGGDMGGRTDGTIFSGNNRALQERFNELVMTEQESKIRISENWKQGYWSVRGCALDRGEMEFGEKGIQISSIIPFEDEMILVGRTDGSICWLQIGSEEYLATFTNQLTAKEGMNDENTISITNELKRDEPSSIPMPRDDPASPQLVGESSKFEILSQLQTSKDGKITNMAVIKEHSYLFVSSDSTTTPLQVFSINEDGPISGQGMNLPVNGEVRIQAIRDTNVLSIDRNGIVCRWSVNAKNGGTISMSNSFQISLDYDDMILCCDADKDYVYFGTTSGTVLIYSVDQILNSDSGSSTAAEVEPLKTFTSFSNAGVSRICAAGEGIMGRGRGTSTVALITGSTDGDIKQWELLPRGMRGVEYWPKLSSQTLQGKAHLLQGMTEVSPILNLCPVQDGIILSATSHQLVIWDSTTGQTLCTMEGLDFDQGGASCLVLSRYLLITNGMNQYVCVHDFSIDPNLELKDMLAPMDDGDE